MSGGAPDVLVVGAGICGLTSAICLAEAGLAVTIRAARRPAATTSAASGAIWGPHLVEQSERVTRWSRVTLDVMFEMAGQPGTGVRVVGGVEVAREPADPVGWATALPGFRLCERHELPPGFVSGWWYTAPVATMPVYLGHLLGRFTRAGGTLEEGTVTSLDAALAQAPVVVNCTGADAARLVPDPDLIPVRGQTVIVANPGITEFFIGPDEDGTRFVYMFPHGDTVLLGGTEEHGNWDTGPDPQTSRRILDGCAAVEPRLANAEILETRVGLRPMRPQVRLTAERHAGGGLLVHNYGHGGAGVTLSWGCARDLAELVLGQVG